MKMVNQPQSFAYGSSRVFMVGIEPNYVTTRSKEYMNPTKYVVEKYASDTPSSSTPPSSSPLHIEQPSNDSII